MIHTICGNRSALYSFKCDGMGVEALACTLGKILFERLEWRVEARESPVGFSVVDRKSYLAMACAMA